MKPKEPSNAPLEEGPNPKQIRTGRLHQTSFGADGRLLLDSERTRRPQQKVDPVQWILPSLGCCYVPLVFMLSAFTSVDDYLDGYSLFVNSGLLLMFLLPVYIVWIIRQRLKKRNVTNELTLFQIISVIPLALWLFFVMTFGGSPA